MWFLWIACVSGAPADHAAPPTAHTPTKETPGMDRLTGTWTYTKDPRGDVPYEDFGEGSKRIFAADGSVTMTMADSDMKLQGKAKARSGDDPLVLDIDWGGGRQNVYVITFRDSDHIVLREGEDPGGRTSYFSRNP